MVGKALNKKSYYGSEGGSDIAMPPLTEAPPIAQAAPDPWNQGQVMAQPENAGIAPVPEELPREVAQEMAEDTRVPQPTVEPTPALSPTSDANDVEDVTPQKRDVTIGANMRALREAREKAERERDDLMKLLMSQQPKQQPVVEEEEFEIADDALVEGKHINRNMRQQKAQIQAMRDELNAYKQQSSEAIAVAQIKAQYPDFDKVVTPDNIELFNTLEPEIAQSLGEVKDKYRQAVSAYKAIKKFGIYRDEKMEADRTRALQNVAKPRPLASVNPQQGDSPLSKANAFANGEMTSELKEQLRREMFQARKNI